MKKLTFGTPEQLVPSVFCKGFNYQETAINYPVEQIEYKENARGCVLRLPLGKDEHIYGLGLQLKAFDLRNKKLTLRPNADPVTPAGDSHAPVPFFVSTAGYGIYVDTARHAEFYFGTAPKLQTDMEVCSISKVGTSTDEIYAAKDYSMAKISIQIPAAKGVDIYIIEGSTITDVVAQYNMLAGGGCDVPDWGLSALYRCYSQYTDEQVLALADEFKENDFAVGTIGLEPGWQTHSYSCSYKWSERYPDPAAFAKTLRRKGFHINLWEHAFTHPTAPFHQEMIPYSGDYGVWGGLVPDFALQEAKDIFANYHKQIVDLGIDGFKLDECDSSDYTRCWSFPLLAEFPSGLDGEQYHSLFGVLYMQTILQALGEHPTLSEVRNAGALSAPYPFVLYSDLYEHKDFIRGCATAGFSGILWTPELRDAQNKMELIRRLQSTVFSVQCLINAWYCPDVPWRELDCSEEVKELLKLREQLKPMLTEAFKKYHNEGVAPVRALVSDFTGDEETYAIDDEYLFCEKLLVAPIAAGESGRDVYLPPCGWRDYFTKEPVESGWHHVETNGIPVYERMD